LLALTHPASMTVFTHFSFADCTNLYASTSITAFSNSKDISLLSSKLSSHFSCILLSISLFTELFRPEKEKLFSFFISQTRGNNSKDIPHFSSYS